jgi:putative ABC transport system permease protein
MPGNIFKTTWRKLIRDPQFSLLNLLGLSTGLACAVFIYLWVNDEWHVDRFNLKDERLYQVMLNGKSQDGIETIGNTPGLLATALAKEMPEVEYAASVIPSSWFANKGLISFADKNIRVAAQFVSRDYFQIFTLDFIAGDKNKLAPENNNIAISEDLARLLYGSINNVIGKTVEWNQEGFSGNYLIAGIFKKLLPNASMQFDILFNYDLFLERNPKLQQWTNNDPDTYLILKKGARAELFNKKIAGFLKGKNADSEETLFIQRFSDKYLHNHYENGVVAGGRISYLKLFSLIAAFILIIACINFMNLSTARASKRIRETGIKKVLGADRRGLILQYMIETILFSFLSLLFAILIIIIFLPLFNKITGKDLRPDLFSSFVPAIFSITLITGLVAGIYPAIYLTRFRAVMVLKGKLISPAAELLLRKGLVIFQFTLSVVLILSVLIVYQQIGLIQTKNLGYNRDHIIYFEKGGKLSDNKEDYKPGGPYQMDLENFIDGIKKIPGVIDATNFRHSITNRHGGTTDINWPGKSPADQTSFTDIAAGFDFIETLGIRMKEGRSFSRNYGLENARVVLNEAAVDAMGLKNPIGKRIKIWGEDREIIGVTENFHFESLYSNIKPCFFDFSLGPRVSKIMVKINAGSERPTLALLSKFYKDYTGEALDYKFLNKEYQALYISEQRVASLSRYFACMAIIISLLGLYGLSAFAVQKRQKEIGIRKVIGASAAKLACMLSQDFLTPVLIAVLIAFPLSWLLMSRWLEGFAYRIQIGPGVFIITAMATLFIAMATIGTQTIKAAVINPIESLRSE